MTIFSSQYRMRYLVILLFICQISCGQDVILADKLNEIKSLVLRSNEPIFLEALIPDPAKRAEWELRQQKNDAARIDAIKTMPGITPYLFELLKECYKTNPNEALDSVFEAIALREDLKASEVESIATEAKRILSRPYVRSDIGTLYLKGAVLVLGKFPSADHEKIVIAALERGEEEFPLYVRAAHSLEQIGGRDSLDALDRAILKARLPKNRWASPFYDSLIISKKIIQAKVKDEVITPNSHGKNETNETNQSSNAPQR